MKLQLVRDKNDRGSEVAFTPFVYVGKLLVKLEVSGDCFMKFCLIDFSSFLVILIVITKG